jgi:RNA polymerase sigma-70 factor (ECF subfamily)
MLEFQPQVQSKGGMTETPLSDEQLIAAVLAGERDAFGLLVERHKQMLFALILRQVRQASLAEELSQESFVKAYLGLKSFRGKARFSTWLTRIGLNQVSSYFNSARFKQQRLQESFELERHEMSSDQQEDCLLQERKNQAFRIALAKLKPKFREVIVLCGLEGKSYEEAAQVLEVPIGTIRSRLNTARLQLQESIASAFFSGAEDEHT